MAEIRCKVCYDSRTQKADFFRLEDSAWQKIEPGDEFLGDYIGVCLDVDEMTEWDEDEWTEFFNSICDSMDLRRRDTLVLCVESDEAFYDALDTGLDRCEGMEDTLSLSRVEKDATKALKTIFAGISEVAGCSIRRAPSFFPWNFEKELIETADVKNTVCSVFKSNPTFSDGMAEVISNILDNHQRFYFNSREEMDEELGKALAERK